MGGNHSKAFDQLAKVESQVDNLGNDLQQILVEHREHAGRTCSELRRCKLCADPLASFSMRVYDVQHHIDKLAAGDSSGKYHCAHSHRPLHERQQLSFNARAILDHIQEVLDHDIYHIRSQPNPRRPDLSLPVIRRQHAHVEGLNVARPAHYAHGESAHHVGSEHVHAPEHRRAHGPAPLESGSPAAFDFNAYFGKPEIAPANYNIGTQKEMDELERMANGLDLPEEARPGEGQEDVLITATDLDPLPSHPDSHPDSLREAYVQPDGSFAEPGELRSRLSALSTGQMPLRRVTNRRGSMPARKHNVSLSIRPPPVSMGRGHARMPSVPDSQKTGDSDSTHATLGDGLPDVSLIPDLIERDDSYSPRRQSSMDVPATTQEEGARMNAIREAAHSKASRKDPVQVSLARAQQGAKETMAQIDKEKEEDDDNGRPGIEIVFNTEHRRQGSNSSRFETLEEKLDMLDDGGPQQWHKTARI